MPPKMFPWLLLITNLPGQNQTLRMRIWRALKAGGAGLLRDGVYVLPSSTGARSLFEGQAAEVQAGGGSAYLVPVEDGPTDQVASFAGLFDRTAEYDDLFARLKAWKHGLSKLAETEARRQAASLNRDAAALAAIDFFPGTTQQQLTEALSEVEHSLNARFAPDEPTPTRRSIPRLDRQQYQGRIWATRERLWIDRVSSAWLIRRFIDPKARFLWLKQVKTKPKRALGFDFDGAEFTHVDSRVTFEVLLASFALEDDPALARLAAVVHHLDVGGIPVAEGSGLAAIMTGARMLQKDDDSLLTAMTPVLDCLYCAFERPQKA